MEKTICAWARMDVELWLCFHVTREGPDTLLPTRARPRTEPARLLPLLPLSLPPSSHLLLLGTKQAVLANRCCVILGFFIEFKWLVFLCEKCSAKVQCQTLKMLHLPQWFDHSVHYTPVFDSTVTCCVLSQSPSLLSCATWMMFWEGIRFRLRKKHTLCFSVWCRG